MGPWNHILDGILVPMRRGKFEGEGRPVVKYRDTVRSPVQKRLH